MANLWFLIIGFMANAPLNGDEEPPALADALWRGELQIKVDGPLYTQYLANRTENDLLREKKEREREEGREEEPEQKSEKPTIQDFVEGKDKARTNKNRVIGFVKEKGEFKIDYSLTVRFLLNALGEFSLVAIEDFGGDYMVRKETRHTFSEEKVINEKVHRKQRFMQKVQVSETTTTKIRFEKEGSYSDADFNFGNLRFQPSGRMDKKGAIQVIADLKIPYSGEGTVHFIHERQPRDEEKDPSKKTVVDIKKTVIFPLAFDFTINHRKEAVNGTFQVEADMPNPFPSEYDNPNKQRFRNLLKVGGSYSLTPLFSAKKKKKK